MDSPNTCVLHELLRERVADMLETREDGELLTALCSVKISFWRKNRDVGSQHDHQKHLEKH